MKSKVYLMSFVIAYLIVKIETSFRLTTAFSSTIMVLAVLGALVLLTELLRVVYHFANSLIDSNESTPYLFARNNNR